MFGLYNIFYITFLDFIILDCNFGAMFSVEGIVCFLLSFLYFSLLICCLGRKLYYSLFVNNVKIYL